MVLRRMNRCSLCTALGVVVTAGVLGESSLHVALAFQTSSLAIRSQSATGSQVRDRGWRLEPRQRPWGNVPVMGVARYNCAIQNSKDSDASLDNSVLRSSSSESSLTPPSSPSFESRPDDDAKEMRAASSMLQPPSPPSEDQSLNDDTTTTAVTGTVNERLLSELKQSAQNEKFGQSKMAERLRQFSFRSSKTEAERQAAIAEARDLNGVNPIVALAGATFALACAFGLWILTNTLAEFFALNPIVETDVYFVTRVTAVARNVVMGLSALASGFFGVTGLGILLLSIRVAYGVLMGELDPTPIQKPSSPSGAANDNADPTLDIKNMWDLMLNKKNKRGQR